MKRLTLLLTLFMLGCATGGGGRRQLCPALVVNNQGLEDVIIYNDIGTRLGRIGGLRSEVIRSCHLLAHPEEFKVVSFPQRFTLSLRGASDYLEATDIVRITIMPSPHLSHIWR